jgi:hypothetical protein
MRINYLVLASAPLLLGACTGGTVDPEAAGAAGIGPGSGGGGGTGGQVSSGAGGAGATSGGAPGGGAPSAGGPSAGSGAGVTATGGASGNGGVTSSGGTGGSGAIGGVMSGGAGAGGSGGAGAGGSGGAAGSAAGSGAGGAPVSSICPYTAPEDPDTFPAGWTRGEVTVFNENGGWTWYNDERVVVDVEGGKLVVGSAASSASSQTQNTNIEVVIHDLASGQNTKKSLGTLSYSDDHNNPGIVVKAPGKYFFAYAHHNVDCNTYWANYDNGSWSQTQIYGWGQHGCTTNPKKDAVTYNNIWKLSSENKIYNFVRSIQTSPSFLLSEDDGATWSLAGRLTASPQVGYNAGYYKYWGNGVDRIDFFATESHPRDSNTSVYHGYVKGGKSYDSLGTEVDANIFDTMAPEITKFTRVFQAGGMLGGASLKRLWNFDVARYDDGTVGVLWQGRENECADKNNCDPKHHFAYSRFDGTAWKSTRLVKGGRTLYRNKSDWWEEDYLGGAALAPDDPHVIYVSTNVDPRDETKEYPVNEIWKGVTCDDGATFTWSPMTMNSEDENLRPAVPKWNASNSALLWFRGNYQTAQMYSAQVVGILERE